MAANNRRNEIRDQLSKAGGFYSSKWNFIKRIEIGNLEKTSSYLFFGSGPFIHGYVEKNDSNTEEFKLESRLCVFEATGTHVQGIEYLHTNHFLIWGGAYFAMIPTEKLMLGGILCRGDVLSAGKQIVSAKVYGTSPSLAVFELYFIDGTVQVIMCRKRGPLLSMALHNIYRLPLVPGEIITTSSSIYRVILLGTSHGRLIAVKSDRIQYITKPILGSAIKQIIVSQTETNATISTLILFENGTIISRKNKNRVAKLKGRYTCISEFKFKIKDDIVSEDKYILAGDMDGNVTVIRVDGDVLEIFRTIRNLTLGSITAMNRFNQKTTILGSETGELQFFDMEQLYRFRPYFPVFGTGYVVRNEHSHRPPISVADSHWWYKTADGWFFLKDDKFCKAVKISNSSTKYRIETYLQNKQKLQMKYFISSGIIQEEIAIAYTPTEFYCSVTDYTKNPKEPYVMDHPGECLKTKDGKIHRIVQVIPMISQLLIQYETGRVKLFYIDKCYHDLVPVLIPKKFPSRVTAAVCIERSSPKYREIMLCPADLMVTYLDGSAEVINIDWNDVGSARDLECIPYVADLQGSYFVSAIASEEHLGIQICLLLSRKGIIYKASPMFLGEDEKKVYSTIDQKDLSPILGHGHSLIETSLGIIATGFRRHTLNVCKLFVKGKNPSTYCHLFSVDTRSSRLPFTIIEEKRLVEGDGQGATNHLIVFYQDKDGAKEEQFPFKETKSINRSMHTGIIANYFVLENFKISQEQFCTGDTDGNLCIWAFDQKSVTGQKYRYSFKLNGAVTGIHEFDNYTIAVSTSQGDLHLYRKGTVHSFDLMPSIPCNLGGKISCLASGQNPLNNQQFLLVFQEDGTVRQIKLDADKLDVYEPEVEKCINIKKVAKFPVATKMGACWNFKKSYYIMALGVDGILRRIQLTAAKNVTIELKWKISVIKEVRRESHMLMVGDPQGCVYFIFSSGQIGSRFYIDRIHKQEVIDVVFHAPSPIESFLFSMDISGTVVIRNIVLKNFDLPEHRPIIWASGVPSPRKLVLIRDKREIMIIGRGVATRKY